MTNKIGWCSMTWNPCWGCRNKCPYCYARAIAKRFWKQRYMEEFAYQYKLHPDWVWTGDHLLGLQKFRPTWLESKYQRKLPKSPQRIFVGSMSDIYYWEPEWIGRVIEKVKQYPQHTFMFLTKHPEVYINWKWPKNCWLGATITNRESFSFLNYLDFRENVGGNILYISYEPLLSDHVMGLVISYIDWVIVGAETGNRKGKVIPNGSWVFNILDFCKRHNIPIYIKDNLTKYYSEYRGYQNFPTINKP